MRRARFITFLSVAVGFWGMGWNQLGLADFRAGAAMVDVTPTKFPVIVNGGFLERTVAQVTDPLNARCLVLADDQETICIVVVDSCMVPRDVCDRIKDIASGQTDIQANRILIAATHTHSAPSLMDHCLGSRRDDGYTEFLIRRVAQGIVEAKSRMQPAEAGWQTIDAPRHTYCRRWIRRPDRIGKDPFGQFTVRAMMHPGHQNPDYLGPAGPVDSGLTVLSIRTRKGEPICLFANYSMHYVGGASGLSADYWGHFDHLMRGKLSASGDHDAHFVAMMSQGTSGDLHWMDYARPRQPTTAAKYAGELAAIVFQAYNRISHRQDVDLAMAQTTLRLQRRLPNAERQAWARELNDGRDGGRPKNRPEVYAEQAVWIQEHPKEEIVLQAVRIGQLGITAMPNEVFGVTGLKIKAQSPLKMTLNMELANGAAGYIPPPEQHALGGYTTWPARTAGLETQAEPKIVDRLLGLLEQVSGTPRRALDEDPYPPEIRAHMRAAMAAQP